MNYGFLILLFAGLLLVYLELKRLNQRVAIQQKQIDELCRATGNQDLASYYLSDDVKEYVLHLKNSGKEVEAVKKVREVTAMSLADAKQYVDKL